MPVCALCDETIFEKESVGILSSHQALALCHIVCLAEATDLEKT